MTVAVVWVLAAALVAALFWVLPRAAASRQLAAEQSELRAAVTRAEAAVATAQAKVNSLAVQLANLEEKRDELVAQAENNSKRIGAINDRIKELEAERAAAEEAARAAQAAAIANGLAPGERAPRGPTPSATLCWPDENGNIVCFKP